ncbi:efflux transporter periplasmic adaptor subunit [Pseudoxanthomonas jiangsuensis]|uniref:efflux RND transporter periplasmic adaptor subunit n=1 Tax=Pseudoxanthomonas jiangsuensis TaxID=619688 RepID=UPI001390ABB2|nr:efflux RND transporter periplasmic adaptor subunit [Pseudoxanthomonas jiangsuensis]KAF1693172.1 efflux transporter periplasmic adaptor subunit [Pseudoxanthomonas jiangsuensis]
MKNVAKIAAPTLLLGAVLMLAACGGSKDATEEKTAPAKEASAEGDDHGAEGEAGHEEGEAGHGEEAGGHEEEGAEKTTIPQEEADKSGVKVAKVSEGAIKNELEAQGVLTPMEGGVAQVTARYPGVVRTLRANVGDTVRQGQALAVVHSNLSLTTYTITAPISGVVLSRQGSVGGVAAEGQPLFEIGDLSKVWVDLHVFGADAQYLRPGVAVTVSRLYDNVSATTTIERVLPSTSTASQSLVARAALPNEDGFWRPGTAVKAQITMSTSDAGVVIPQSAIQSMDGKDVVFVRDGDTYTARPVKLGDRDSTQVAVLEGVKAGEDIVVTQSYLVKADIEKSGATHAH